MIIKSTVFVLGAGASKPYGLPLGSELKQEILDVLDEDNASNRMVIELLAKAGGKEYEKTKLSMLRKTLSDSGDGTIDAFIETHEELADTAKRVVAYILLSKEIRENVMRPPTKEGQASDWYAEVLRIMKADFAQFTSNRVSFITFNYDRSLEHFLYTALSSRHRSEVTAEQWADVIRQIPVVHVHGDLGVYHELGKDADRDRLGYGHKISDLSVRFAGSRINVVHENNAAVNANYKLAHELLRLANFVFFLGFGYDERNLRRLQLDQCLDPLAKVSGSGVGLTSANKAQIQQVSNGKIHQNHILSFACLQFLKESPMVRQIYEIR